MVRSRREPGPPLVSGSGRLHPRARLRWVQERIHKYLAILAGQSPHFVFLNGASSGSIGAANNEIGERTPLDAGGIFDPVLLIGVQPRFKAFRFPGERPFFCWRFHLNQFYHCTVKNRTWKAYTLELVLQSEGMDP